MSVYEFRLKGGGNKILSLCMIVKNEEKYIKQCLNSIYDYVDEIIIVDTGSTDKTINICREFGAQIFYFEWNANFSDARNYGISMAKGDWIFVLDADEYVDNQDRLKLLHHIEYMEEHELDATYCIRYDYLMNGGWSEADIIRLFRNKPEISYRGAIYESVKMSKTRLFVTRDQPIKIHHVGFLKDKEIINKKRETYLRMTDESINKTNDYRLYYWEAQNAFIYGNYLKAIHLCKKGFDINKVSKRLHELLGRIYMFYGEYDKAQYYFEQVLALAEEEKERKGILQSKFYIRALNNLVELYFQRGYYEHALDKIKGNLIIEPSAYLYANQAYIYQHMHRYDEALKSYKQALSINSYLGQLKNNGEDGFACLARTFYSFHGINENLEYCKNQRLFTKKVL